MALLIFYLLLALVVSFLCSIMESVLLATPQAYLLVKQEEGYSWAKQFVGLKKDIDKPLSAILSLNTVAHTIGAAGVGAQAVEVFGEAYFGVVSAVLTILILVITEIIPKTIGAKYSKNLAKVSTAIMRGMIFITYPLVLMSAVITKLITKNSEKQTASREELAALATIGATEGVFSNNEHIIIRNLLKLKNIRAAEIMTPRVVVAIADENMPLKEFVENKEYLKYSRIPVYAGKTENITGYVLRHTAFEKLVENQNSLTLKDIKRDIEVVSNRIMVFALWEKLLESKEHIALITDDFGGMDGIVTLEDIIETLLGLEIMDERDTVADMQKLAKERWEARQRKYKQLDKLDTTTDSSTGDPEN